MARSAIQRLGSSWVGLRFSDFVAIPNYSQFPLHASLALSCESTQEHDACPSPTNVKGKLSPNAKLDKARLCSDSDTVPLRALSHEIKLRPKVVLSKLRAQIRPSRRTRTHSSGRNEGSTWKRAKNTEKKHETISLLKTTVNEETSISIAGRRVLLSEAFWKLLLSDARKSQVWGLQLTR